jgi:ethanolamine ammonia-lyase large subunit
MYRTIVRGERFSFGSLREVLAKANEEKSGDRLAGLAARSERERVAAKLVLADLPLAEFRANPVIDDEITTAVLDAQDTTAFAEIASLTVSGFTLGTSPRRHGGAAGAMPGIRTRDADDSAEIRWWRSAA